MINLIIRVCSTVESDAKRKYSKLFRVLLSQLSNDFYDILQTFSSFGNISENP